MHGWFDLLTNIQVLTAHALHNKTLNLQNTYSDDLEQGFVEEAFQFHKFVNGKPMSSPYQYNIRIKEQRLGIVFSNVIIALRIYSTLPMINASRNKALVIDHFIVLFYKE